MAKLNSTGQHWVGELSDFYFNIKYQPGESNTDADTFIQMQIPLYRCRYLPIMKFQIYTGGRTKQELQLLTKYLTLLLRLGFLEQIHHDQGKEFHNQPISKT